MSNETITILIAIIALVISAVSLIRTRKNSEIQVELDKINAKLAEKQLSKILESEAREGQPIFVVHTDSVSGIGDFGSPEYKVYIKISIENTGENYLVPRHVVLVCPRDGVFKLCQGAYLEHIDIRELDDTLLGERRIILEPDARLQEGKLHISYLDNKGIERIQQFNIFPEGPKGALPFRVTFSFEKLYSIKPGNLWQL